jgi:hypothetical protein
VLDEHPNVQPLCGELPNVDEPGGLACTPDVPKFIKLLEHFQLYLCWLKNTPNVHPLLEGLLDVDEPGSSVVAAEVLT